MKSLSDMPKPIIIIEIIGIILLVVAYLYINQYMTSPQWLGTYRTINASCFGRYLHDPACYPYCMACYLSINFFKD